MLATNVRTCADWAAPQRALRVRVLGAATAVGRELACRLLESGHPSVHLGLSALRPHSSSWQGKALVVQGFDKAAPAADVAFLCSAHPRAVECASRAMAHGTRLIDLSGCYREREDVPLVLPGTASPDGGVFTQLVALPHRSVALGAPLLFALDRQYGLASVSVLVLASAAADGARGILALRDELSGTAPAEPRVGNVLLPGEGGGAAAELETRLSEELVRLVGRADLPVDLSAVRVDAERCDTLSFHVGLHGAPSVAEVAATLARLGGVTVVPEGDEARLAPRACQGSPEIHVGRIRTGSRGPGSVCFFAVGDQLRVGAAEAAMRVAARFAIG